MVHREASTGGPRKHGGAAGSSTTAVGVTECNGGKRGQHSQTGTKTRENEGNGRRGSEHRGKRARTGWEGAEADAGSGENIWPGATSRVQSWFQIRLAQQRAKKTPAGACTHNALQGSIRTGSIGKDDEPRSELKLKLQYIDSPRLAASGNPSARRNIGRNRAGAGTQQRINEVTKGAGVQGRR